MNLRQWIGCRDYARHFLGHAIG